MRRMYSSWSKAVKALSFASLIISEKDEKEEKGGTEDDDQK